MSSSELNPLSSSLLSFSRQVKMIGDITLCHSMLCSHDTGCASFYQARVESNISSENHKTCFTQKHFSSCDLRFSFLLFTEINLAFALSRRRSSFPPLVDKPFSTTETLCMLVFVDCGELFADDASRWGDLRHRSTYNEHWRESPPRATCAICDTALVVQHHT